MTERLPGFAIRTFQASLDLLFPEHCPVCGQWIHAGSERVETSAIHPRCLSALPRFPPRHASPSPLLAGSPVCSLFQDTPRWFHILHEAKYGGRPALLDPLAAVLREVATSYGWLPSGCRVVALPEDANRRRQRGFSVVERLCRVLARAPGVGVAPDLLVRRKAAPAQARISGTTERKQNVEGLLGVGRLAELETTVPLVLVDDQVTSGATLAAGLRLLGSRGNPVLGLALAAAALSPREVGLDTSGGPFLE